MKKIYFLIIAFLLLAIPVKAEVQTYERLESSNYGVNKKWNITEKNIDNVKKTPLVNCDEKIYDFSNVLTEAEIQDLKKQIDNFRIKYNTEIVILINSVPYVYDRTNEIYATDFYDYNDFGLNYELYDGILLFRNTYVDDPYYDIYTFGNAQLYFSQDDYDTLLDGIYDDLHSGQYYDGFLKFLTYVSDDYQDGIARKNYYVDDMGYLKKKYTPPIFMAVIISGIVTGIFIGVNVSKNKMVKKETNADIYLDAGSVAYSKRENKFVRTNTVVTVIQTSSSGGGGGGGSHSGSSGGGHSSGGGRHG